MISYAKPTMFFSMPEQIIKELDKVGESKLIMESDSEEFDAESLVPDQCKAKENFYYTFIEDMEKLSKVFKAVHEKVSSDEEVSTAWAVEKGDPIRGSRLAQCIYGEFDKAEITAQDEERETVRNGNVFLTMLCKFNNLLFRLFYNEKGYWIDNRICVMDVLDESLGLCINKSEDLITEMSGNDNIQYIPYSYEEVPSLEELIASMDASLDTQESVLTIKEWKRASKAALAEFEGFNIEQVIIKKLTSPTSLPFSHLKEFFPTLKHIYIEDMPAMSVLNFNSENGLDGLQTIGIRKSVISSVKGVNNVPSNISVVISRSMLLSEDIQELAKTNIKVKHGVDHEINAVFNNLDNLQLVKQVGQPINGREIFNELFGANLQIYPSSLKLRISRYFKEDWAMIGNSHYTAKVPGIYHLIAYCRIVDDPDQMLRKYIKVEFK